MDTARPVEEHLRSTCRVLMKPTGSFQEIQREAILDGLSQWGPLTRGPKEKKRKMGEKKQPRDQGLRSLFFFFLRPHFGNCTSIPSLVELATSATSWKMFNIESDIKWQLS